MLDNIKVSGRLFLLTAFSSVITVVIVVFGVFGMGKITENVDVMYNERAAALTQLGKINSNIGIITSSLFRAFQHDPASESSKIHADHSVAEHLDEVEKQIRNIDEAWAIYTSTPLADEESKLIPQFTEGYARFIKEVIRPTIDSLRAGDFSNEANIRFVRGARQLGVPVENVAHALTDVNGKLAGENFEESKKVYESLRMDILIAFVVGLLASVFIAWRIIRSIIIPLSGLQVAMGEIERNGDFTRRVEVSGTDEVGQTAASFNQ
ncbi:MAG: MCP four helix bundle domain-containing protein, partial [Azoarcus sp.]|nr:MCP four helix bundle domain-containing protein [Azoarcus sp.]